MKFIKNDALKARLDLVPPFALELVGWCLRHGAIKYSEENWRKCKKHQKYVAAALRHTFLHLRGLSTDSESGLPHLAHAITSLLFALDLFCQIGEPNSMERKQFSYFAIVRRTSKLRGEVVVRFRSYEKAWTYITDNSLEPSRHLVMTVRPQDKKGAIVRICK